MSTATKRAAKLHKNIARNLTRLRAMHNQTHQQVADALDMTLWTSLRWCSGEIVPSVAQLHELATFYGTTVEALCGEPNE